MSEKQLDRLNYYNGKRLLASDLKLEQEYHIRVRRWLNKSLYSAGIARGLEVREVPGAPAVMVSPGLALDADGREIILLGELRVEVMGWASASPCGGPPGDGSYLTIQYDEEVIAEEDDGCCGPPSASAPRGVQVAWGGPARVRAEPVLRWTDVLPADGSGEVVLAQVSLMPGCGSVQSVDAGVRRYIGAASAAKVRQYALEGVRDLNAHPADADMHQRIYFHIRGRQATSVTLYLRGDKLPSLYYTEVGQHAHSINAEVHPADGQHRHNIGAAATTPAPMHSHKVGPDFVPSSNPFDAAVAVIGGIASALGAKQPLDHKLVISQRFRVPNFGDFPGTQANDNSVGPLFVENGGNHSHTLVANQFTIANDLSSAHTHAVSSNASPAGVTDPTAASTKEYSARSGAPLTFVADLEVWIDGANHTDHIKQQIQAAIPTEQGAWARIGDGTKTHPLVSAGTRGIKLDFLPGLFFAEGEHWIELRLPERNAAGALTPNGGRINYNLYVE